MTETTRLLRDLVRIPSINPMGRDPDESLMYEARVTDYLQRFFESSDVPFLRQKIAPDRENILATYRAPGAARTLLFEVHQDTVPVDQMIIDPFGGVVENGRLYGRGACDVKGGMASMLHAFARLVRERPANSWNVTLACTVDEEHTFLGVQALAEKHRHEPLADMAIVAEPTLLDIVQAHKGTVRWHLTTTGKACHSSAPERGENAIYHMARILPLLEDYNRELGRTIVDPVLGPATISVGRIQGGISVNTVPDQCVIEIDRRVVGGEDSRTVATQLMDYLRSRLGPEVPFTLSEPWLFCPALAPQGSEEITQRLGNAINTVRGEHTVMAVPYGTDASTLSLAGIPSVVFGPGDIAQAHTRDEFIELDQVEAASEILFQVAQSK